MAGLSSSCTLAESIHISIFSSFNFGVICVVAVLYAQPMTYSLNPAVGQS